MFWPLVHEPQSATGRVLPAVHRGIAYGWSCRHVPFAVGEPARTLRDAVTKHARTCTQNGCRASTTPDGLPRAIPAPFVVPLIREPDLRTSTWGFSIGEIGGLDVSGKFNLPEFGPDDNLADIHGSFVDLRVETARRWLTDLRGTAKKRDRVVEIVTALLRTDWGVEVDLVSLRRAAYMTRLGTLSPWPSLCREVVLGPVPASSGRHATDLASWVRQHALGGRRVSILGAPWEDRFVDYLSTEVSLGLPPHTPAWLGMMAALVGWLPAGIAVASRRMVLVDAA